MILGQTAGHITKKLLCRIPSTDRRRTEQRQSLNTNSRRLGRKNYNIRPTTVQQTEMEIITTTITSIRPVLLELRLRLRCAEYLPNAVDPTAQTHFSPNSLNPTWATPARGPDFASKRRRAGRKLRDRPSLSHPAVGVGTESSLPISCVSLSIFVSISLIIARHNSPSPRPNIGRDPLPSTCHFLTCHLAFS